MPDETEVASVDDMERQSQTGLSKAPRDLLEAKEQLLNAINASQWEKVLYILKIWSGFHKGVPLDDFWQQCLQPILERIDVPPSNEHRHEAKNPSNIIPELAKSIHKPRLVQGCFQGALDRSKQLAGSDPEDTSEDEAEDGMLNGNVTVSNSLSGPSNPTAKTTEPIDAAQSKWETIALIFLECHPLTLTPLLSEEKSEPDLTLLPRRGMNYLHLAVLNSSARIVKQLIANIDEHPYHKDNPQKKKALMTALSSGGQNYLDIAIKNDVLNAELIQSLLGAEKTLVHQTERNGIKSLMPLHLFIIEVARRAGCQPEDARSHPSTEDFCTILKAIVDADPGYVLVHGWSGLQCRLFINGRLDEKVTPYQLVSRLHERVDVKALEFRHGESQKLPYLQEILAELKQRLEELIFRYLQGPAIQEAGFDKYGITELDLSDFDTLETQQPINDLAAFVRDFKPPENENSPFTFPHRLARLDLPDMSYGKTSEMATSIKELFTNLKKFKVSQIMRLYAKDNSKDPVDDESIANWVGIFKIEELDWQKADLDIGSFVNMAQSAGSSLRTISLYTNGHWGVLYHWLSLDGLFALKGLRKASIFVTRKRTTNGDHNPERDIVEKAKRLRDENILNAREALRNQNRLISIPDIEIVSRSLPQSTMLTGATGPTLHNQFFTPIESVAEFLERELHDSSKRDECRSKIAVIDNGIAFGLSTVWGSIIKGSSAHFNADGRKIPWFTSKDSHGTYMASLITQVNPLCGLLIYRINSWQHDIRLATAVDGIELALKELKDPPDILNLSWSFNVKSEPLEKALEGVTGSSPTLVFCAKSDELYTPNVWPADYDTTISVASATTSAQAHRVDKPPDVYILGENMAVEAPSYAIQKETVVSGSSVATALASGIASLILTLAKFWHFKDWENLKKRKTMLRVFKEYRQDKLVDIIYLDPKQLFANLEDLQATLRHILNRPE
ncbi:hypothetical protein IFR05_001181 [Cadophora sp. M221]|nr:hypothetical protein IFR05_001181 [Cadophora sp. M221]